MVVKEIQVIKDVFISDLYCLYLRDENACVISDLHLGFEEEMNLHGLFLPKMQREHVEGLVDRIIERYSPEKIIINGDFKQEFSRNLPQEWEDILHFIDRYQGTVELVFVRGNHDNYLQTILSRRGIRMHEAYETDRYFIYHGDRDRGLKKITILGHEHPSVVLRDKVGGVFKMPAFPVNAEQGVIITPSMSFYSSGTDVLTSLISEEHFTPALRKVDPKKFRIFSISEEFGIIDMGYLGDMGSVQG
ncbi:phosphoesterase [Thermogymnomonas acidicola]|uniref:Phosphoesterase n=1 Tax=Thermogymnomonas acidicola TaxID=399579 RepID=A0AA37BSK3_9ARCH|nr:phosphoesterase [Thermogymnomonas acidicola]